MNKKQLNQKLLSENELVGEIHDRLLDDNDLSLSDAYNDACVWIAELYLEIEKLQQTSSSGYARRRKI